MGMRPLRLGCRSAAGGPARAHAATGAEFRVLCAVGCCRGLVPIALGLDTDAHLVHVPEAGRIQHP